MTTLVIAWESPVPPNSGSRLRFLHLARQLSTVTDVVVVALGDVPAVDEPFELVSIPHDVGRSRALLRSWRSPYLAARYESPELAAFVRSRRWDVVQTESAWLVDEAITGDAPVILDAHNVEEDIVRSLAAADARRLHRVRWRWEAAKTHKAERAAVRQTDVVVACSAEDARRLVGMGAPRALVVPNGVDTAAIPYAPPSTEPRVVYVGQLGYRPNEVAALELADRVLPLVRAEIPTATLRIVGRHPSAAIRARVSSAVEVTGEVADVLPHLRAAGVVVVPLTAGSGTRLKILEAMAAGVPVVTTALGVAGIDAVHERHVLIGESPSELARLAVRVMQERDLSGRLSSAARSLVEERYDWRIVARPLLDLHAELASVA